MDGGRVGAPAYLQRALGMPVRQDIFDEACVRLNGGDAWRAGAGMRRWP
jgi:hypothetical protein